VMTRVRMARGPSARFECDACSTDTGGRWRREQWIDADCTGEPIRVSFG
jgi:hypothetical protein